MAWENREEDRLDGKVARAFHKHVRLERHISASAAAGAPGTAGTAGTAPTAGTTPTGTASAGTASEAASAATAAATAATISKIIQLNPPLTSIATATTIAQSYPLVVDSKKIMVDDKIVMVYWRKALEIPFGRIQGAQMRINVEEAIADLAIAFPPPRPKVSDVRYQHFEEALRKHGSGNCGVYHFARWVAIGQR
ncbi:hypothetical protein L211DRAFT_843382 [Terfezia boudieri ATCC MYA-4762]|uniref:Uncharacterized protein n=1 Tax=Terfezia boudieri ATCC MYA-4762 TaxID=1051890 RepID=A0A3N4LAY8_9PEZI|nr:hypothetical protein L211DRAFT_843382 [Terfezia boudieri ATCC MYA-4762]